MTQRAAVADGVAQTATSDLLLPESVTGIPANRHEPWSDVQRRFRGVRGTEQQPHGIAAAVALNRHIIGTTVTVEIAPCGDWRK